MVRIGMNLIAVTKQDAKPAAAKIESFTPEPAPAVENPGGSPPEGFFRHLGVHLNGFFGRTASSDRTEERRFHDF